MRTHCALTEPNASGSLLAPPPGGRRNSQLSPGMSDDAPSGGRLPGEHLRAAVSSLPPSGGMEGGGNEACRSREREGLKKAEFFKKILKYCISVSVVR